ncbi:MAG: hypothetical protein PHP54_02605 [Clostridia bacterium]|nr:hypothetical protein [Clostridia bacterium]
MKERKNNNSGISLITLVITIIVVIILAAAVILTLNNNNPINNAKEATFKQDASTVQDDLNLYIADKYANSNGSFDMNALNLSDSTTPKITDELTSVQKSKLNGKVEVKNGKLVFTGTTETEKKWFEEIIQGGTTSGGGTEPTIPETTTPPTEIVTENTKYKDKNNQAAVIPKGFKVSAEPTEQIIAAGLVIKDEQKNEFVWIPVDNITDFIREDWGKGYTEAQAPEDDKTTEYIAMKESVRINGGYYIARYEAGIPDTTQSATSDHGIAPDGTKKPVSKKGVGVWNYIEWGVNNDTVTSGDGAVTVARSMYPKEDSNTGVVSTLCYDVQWDVALKFIKIKNDAYPTDSTDKGNYTGELLTTGYYEVNHIYDMAGNVWELTMAAYDTTGRVARGGDYDGTGNTRPGGYRTNYTHTSNYYKDVGYRIALYIK